MKNEKNINEPTKKKNNIGLKVTGIILGIILGVVILAYIFSKLVVPMMMYNNAMNQANQGNYAEAYNILADLRCYDYKDSAERRGEYAFKVGVQHYEIGNMDEAIDCFDIAYNSKNAEASQMATEYFLLIGEKFFSDGNIEKAKECFNKATASENEEVSIKAENYLKTPELE